MHLQVSPKRVWLDLCGLPKATGVTLFHETCCVVHVLESIQISRNALNKL